jgi:hypothetical protein
LTCAAQEKHWGLHPGLTYLEGAYFYFKYNNPEPEQAPVP